MKLKHLFARRQAMPRPLYGAIVAAARQPNLYVESGIADNADRRLDLLTLYLCLVVNRLKAKHPADAQALVDLYVADVEGNLRELGVSDVAIPRHMRQVEALYVTTLRDLQSALQPADKGDNGPLQDLLSGLLQPVNVAPVASAVLAAYRKLTEIPAERILAGEGLTP